jgi:hypothetical protein
MVLVKSIIKNINRSKEFLYTDRYIFKIKYNDCFIYIKDTAMDLIRSEGAGI